MSWHPAVIAEEEWGYVGMQLIKLRARINGATVIAMIALVLSVVALVLAWPTAKPEAQEPFIGDVATFGGKDYHLVWKSDEALVWRTE